jgi:hypothetical protein
MASIVKDGFDFGELECQYLEVCDRYSPGDCDYAATCNIRRILRRILAPHVGIKGLQWQMFELQEERKRERNR